MFFIVPTTSQNDQSVPSLVVEAMSTSQATEPPHKRKRVVSTEAEGSSKITDTHRKRIPRACDRCRLKKAKCSGGAICEKCRRDGVVCVTTLVPKKDEHTLRPGYIHLIESQRDQLAQALQKMLEARDTSDLTKIEMILADMGVAVDTFDFTSTSLDNGECQDPAGSTISSPQTTLPHRDDVFSNLDEPQLEAVELFSLVTTPPVPESSLEASFRSSNPGDTALMGYTTRAFNAPFCYLELTDFSQMYNSEYSTMSLNDVSNGGMDFDSAILFQ